MSRRVHLLQRADGNVRVNLRGLDVLVSEDLLNETDVGSVLVLTPGPKAAKGNGSESGSGKESARGKASGSAAAPGSDGAAVLAEETQTSG